VSWGNGLPPVSRPVVFTPLAGTLAILERVAKRYGIGDLWERPEGLREVAQEFLIDLGMPVKPVVLTPREIAERAGVVRKRKRRLK
jgi:hypothetical protein